MISISKVGACVDIEWKAKNAPMIWGSPGIGKSAIIKQLCKQSTYKIDWDDALAKSDPLLAEEMEKTHTSRPVFDVRLSLMSPTDLKGIPVFDATTGDAIWVMSGIFATDPTRLAALKHRYIEMDPGNKARNRKKLIQNMHSQYGVIFLDELTQAPPSVLASAFGLVLDRRINDYQVPPNVDVVAASNKMTDKSATNKMPAALYSRFCHYMTACPSVDQWIADYAEPAGISTDIIAFLKGNPTLFYTFDSRNQAEDGSAGTYACPRTWDFLDRKLKVFEKRSTVENTQDLSGYDATIQSVIGKRNKAEASMLDDSYPSIVEAAVGPGVATTFIGWQKTYRSMPPMEDYLEGRHSVKEMTKLISRPDGTVDVGLVYAMTTNLLHQLSVKHNEKRVKRGLDLYVDQHRDWQVVLWSKVIDKIRQNPTAPAYRALTDYEGFKQIARALVHSKAVGVNT